MTMKEIVYSGEQEFLLEYENNGYDISDVTETVIIGEQPVFLLNKLKGWMNAVHLYGTTRQMI